jgi:hypothetical protein
LVTASRQSTSLFEEGSVAADSGAGTPKSPEVQEPYVREELDQDLITHKGDWRKASITSNSPHRHHGGHLGALEDENVPVLPPMSGPADLIGEFDVDGQGNETGKTKVGEETFDPRDELTPG